MGPERDMRIFLRSKIHKATVTNADLHYVGSITIDEALMEKADLTEYERVLVVDNTNGHRLETYVIKGSRGTGAIEMNGAAAHLIQTGDEIIIMSFEVADRPSTPRNVLVDAENKFVRYLTEESSKTADGC
jgi:aspartate 1-decarboxylase